MKISLNDKMFGSLTVSEKFKKDKNNQTYWLCVCKCGIEKYVRANHLLSGSTISCNTHCQFKKPTHIKHNMSRERPYRIWICMKTRCGNKKHKQYKDYGGRGISICTRWSSFCDFWDDMKEGYADNLQIDRIDNNGNYEPKNCRWVTPQQNQKNKRITKIKI